MCDLASYTQIGVEPDANSIRQQFAAAHGWENQYRLIIQLGKQLPALPGEWQQEAFRLKGCESQAWLKGRRARMIAGTLPAIPMPASCGALSSS